MPQNSKNKALTAIVSTNIKMLPQNLGIPLGRDHTVSDEDFLAEYKNASTYMSNFVWILLSIRPEKCDFFRNSNAFKLNKILYI